jgi:hypothetical protein
MGFLKAPAPCVLGLSFYVPVKLLRQLLGRNSLLRC